MHSYHYFWPSVVKGVVRKEVYAREIGLELERTHIPDVIVKESPRNRNVNVLLRKYKSKWLLDLHDPARQYNPSIDDKDGIADLVYHNNPKIRSYLRRFVETNYQKRHNVRFEPFYPIHLFRAPYENYNPRLLQIELSPWVPKEVSLDFLQKFTVFLKSTDIC